MMNHGIHRTHGSATHGRAALVAAMFAFSFAAIAADPTITVSAQQRYPWNGFVDLNFTITGTSGMKYDTSFTAKDLVGNTNIAMRTIRKSDGSAANVAKEQLLSGTYNWVWDAAADLPKDFQCDRVTVMGKVVEPERNYMVVNLSSGAVSYLESVPSGGWNNTYKSSFMVLRRIPATSSVKEFYIGIYEVTQAQWTKLGMSNDSPNKSSYYPDTNMSGWEARQYIKNIRNITGVGYFCFPSEAQWLAAANYGPGGFKTASTEYVVGSLAANSLGIYDLKGNVEEWIRFAQGQTGYGAIGSYYGANTSGLNGWQDSVIRGPSASWGYMGMRLAYSTTDYKSSNGSGAFD